MCRTLMLRKLCNRILSSWVEILLLCSQAAIGSRLLGAAGAFSHLSHSIDTLASLSTVRTFIILSCTHPAVHQPHYPWGALA